MSPALRAGSLVARLANMIAGEVAELWTEEARERLLRPSAPRASGVTPSVASHWTRRHHNAPRHSSADRADPCSVAIAPILVETACQVANIGLLRVVAVVPAWPNMGNRVPIQTCGPDSANVKAIRTERGSIPSEASQAWPNVARPQRLRASNSP